MSDHHGRLLNEHQLDNIVKLVMAECAKAGIVKGRILDEEIFGLIMGFTSAATEQFVHKLDTERVEQALRDVLIDDSRFDFQADHVEITWDSLIAFVKKRLEAKR